ncbi:porin [Aminobacter sp. AP02]|uniref:porin n=1 Tax=Aminobacter sp. AP02 TaxID=2135737 RepID=UPI000D6BBF5F|nr:porin [Aminobacter sp. AP02]PWK75689.1 porin-like protein [Aminobacter sp. AP02]
MNIKSLLLGSAAALLAVSGARAADAVVVAEPEPMEYVRICDVYGAGFYYIPGTETCLKIGGLVRYQISSAQHIGDEGWNKQALARLKFDARSETEYGTFRRYIEFQASVQGGGWSNEAGAGRVQGQPGEYWRGVKGESGTALRHAYFELGGLLVGHTDTLFDGDLSGEFDAGGGDRVNQIRYTFDAGNGIAVSLGLEEESDNFDYVPLVVGKVAINQGWGSLNLYAGYDNAYEEFALKAIANFKATDALTLQVLAGYESGPTFWSINQLGAVDNFQGGVYKGYAWTVAGYLKYQVNEKLAVGFGGQYFGDAHDNNLGGRPVGGDNDYSLGAVVDYNIVENLDAKLALNYFNGDTLERTANGGGFAGFLRLDASF